MLALLAIILLMIITYLIPFIMSVMTVHMAASWLLYSGKLATLCTYSTNGIGEILPLTLPFVTKIRYRYN